MALKKIEDITEKDLAKLKQDLVIILEKIDGIPFTIYVNDSGFQIKKNGKVITDLEYVLNDSYSFISDFIDEFLKPNHTKLLSLFGKCDIGFIFLPIEKTRHILYPERNESNKFFISNIYVDDIRYKTSFTDMMRLLEDILGIPTSVIREFRLSDEIESYLDTKDKEKFIFRLTDNSTKTGIDCHDMEGVIIKYGNIQYQFIMNETSFKVNNSKIGRDYILSNFAKVVLEDKDALKLIVKDKTSFLEIIEECFIFYMNNTDLFKKVYIDSNELVPPHEGYTGDLDISKLHSETSKLICSYTDNGKNILKLLLYSFSGPEKEERFNSSFIPEKEANLLRSFHKKLKEIQINII